MSVVDLGDLAIVLAIVATLNALPCTFQARNWKLEGERTRQLIPLRNAINPKVPNEVEFFGNVFHVAVSLIVVTSTNPLFDPLRRR